jgi:hypothetical protein
MNKIYNTLTLFINKFGGKPIIKDGMPVKKQDGTNFLNASFNGIITLKESLPAGEYKVDCYEKVSAKGAIYYSAIIKEDKQKINER